MTESNGTFPDGALKVQHNDVNKIADDALGDPDVAQLYFNGHICRLSNRDITITLLRNDKPQIVLNCSYTVTKSLMVQLRGVIDHLEKITKHEIMTSDEVLEGMQASLAEGDTK